MPTLRNFIFILICLFTVSESVSAEDPIVVLVSYAHGNQVHFLNRDVLVESAEDKGIDLISSYTYSMLDQGFRKEYRHILKKKRGAGYWLWKPWIILNEMQHQPEGSIIVYVDAGAYITRHLGELLEVAKKTGFIAYENEHTNLPYVKRDCYILMDCDSPKYYHAIQLQAGMLFLLNNEENRAFVSEWLEYCKDERILTDKRSTLEENFPEFIAHRHDQAILSLLVQKAKKAGTILKFDDVEKHFHLHRRRRADQIITMSDER